jgi:hypothetical protein
MLLETDEPKTLPRMPPTGPEDTHEGILFREAVDGKPFEPRLRDPRSSAQNRRAVGLVVKGKTPWPQAPTGGTIIYTGDGR